MSHEEQGWTTFPPGNDAHDSLKHRISTALVVMGTGGLALSFPSLYDWDVSVQKEKRKKPLL